MIEEEVNMNIKDKILKIEALLKASTEETLNDFYYQIKPVVVGKYVNVYSYPPGKQVRRVESIHFIDLVRDTKHEVDICCLDENGEQFYIYFATVFYDTREEAERAMSQC